MREEETKVAAALARVGQEAVAALNSPQLLDRLGEVANEVLECDTSYTLLWRADEDAFLPVAGYGATAEEREIARAIKVPREMMSVLLARLEGQEVATVDATLADVPMTPAQRRAPQLCMALRRGGQIVGLQVASRHGSSEPFTPGQLRIAQGIAQIASLALDHTRLVQELEQANRLKSEFLATLSHELRTPLHGIIGCADLLVLDGELGNLTPEQAQHTRMLVECARDLAALIETMFDVSRLQTGDMPVQISDVNLSQMIEELGAEMAPEASKAGVDFRCDLAADLSCLRTDRAKLKIVLRHLVANAFKFTDQGSVIVTVRPNGEGIEFLVSDTGVGVAPEAREVIFDLFRQADGSSTRRYGGLGLGLFIVRRLTDLLGGTISVESEPGRGSTFRLWLPLWFVFLDQDPT